MDWGKLASNKDEYMNSVVEKNNGMILVMADLITGLIREDVIKSANECGNNNFNNKKQNNKKCIGNNI